ncbi:MAG: TetR/AcrR family transcriptional regulator [Myxococcota bacterium]
MSVPRRGPGRPSNPISRDTLLSYAREAFADAGYAGASMDDIARRAGLRKSSLFHHFPSKEKLYEEALAGVVLELAELIATAANLDTPFGARADWLTENLVRHLGANPYRARLLLREFVDAHLAIEAAGYAAKGAIDAAAVFLEQGMTEGVIPRQDPLHLAFTFVGIHLTFFAMPELGQLVFGTAISTPSAIEARVHAVVLQTRRLLRLDDKLGH